MNPNQSEASSSKSHFFPPSPSPTPVRPTSEHGEPQYTFTSHGPHTDTEFPNNPLEPSPPIYSSSSTVNLREPPSPDLIPAVRPTLAQFRSAEGPGTRSAKLSALWDELPDLPKIGDGPTDTQRMKLPGQDTMTALSPERAERLRKLYEEELVRRCSEQRPAARLWGGPDNRPEQKNVMGKGIQYEDFRRFLWDQESQLWDIFQDLDKNGDGRLDATEMRAALSRSGIDVTPATVVDLVRFLASGSKSSTMGRQTPQIEDKPQPAEVPKTMDQNANSGTGVDDMYITFQEFRDFLIMLPRKATPLEIYKFYQVRKRSDGRGAARVDKEGDISISFPKRNTPPASTTVVERDQGEEEDFGDTIDTESIPEERNEAWRFLLAGGLAGAVSRSVTAPFDRLKIYLITTVHPLTDPKAALTTSAEGGITHPIKAGGGVARNLWTAMTRIYIDGGGVRAFWVGNGLNIIKILPESAIKFLSYEQTKKVLARYWDRVQDPSELSSSSRFLAGGVGGITSQFAIYGLETLKTRIQSETGPTHVAQIARAMWREGKLRSFYRGLTLGLIGVFPYSAIDMGTYETLKRAYCKSTGKDEPEVLATLGFGAMSGSIGAASVYPVNLLRTRLQASGSSGHPQAYTGFRDVLTQTLAKEGWRGLYKGLLPSIMKVGPAVGVSWIVYEDAKRRLGV